MLHLDMLVEKLKKCELVRETEVKALCMKAKEILVEEANVQNIDLPVTVPENFFWPTSILYSVRCAGIYMGSGMT